MRNSRQRTGPPRLYLIPVLSKALDILELLQAGNQAKSLEEIFQQTNMDVLRRVADSARVFQQVDAKIFERAAEAARFWQKNLDFNQIGASAYLGALAGDETEDGNEATSDDSDESNGGEPDA